MVHLGWNWCLYDLEFFILVSVLKICTRLPYLLHLNVFIINLNYYKYYTIFFFRRLEDLAGGNKKWIKTLEGLLVCFKSFGGELPFFFLNSKL